MVSKFTSQPDGKEIAEKINDIIDNTNLGDLSNVSISSPSAGQNLTYDATNNVWKNTSTSATVAWGGITGTLADQTDLANALSDKYDASNPNGYTSNVGTVTSVNNVSPVNGNVTLTIPSVDYVLSTTSTNPVQNKVISSALDDKQDTLTALNAGTDISIINTANRNKTVSGDNSVFLGNAISNGLNSVILTGACIQNGTPNPTTPMDIICNNGRLVVENVFDKDADDAVANVYPTVVPIGSTTGINNGGSNNFKALLMPAKPNTEYVFKRLTDCGAYYNRIRVVSLTSSAPPLTISSGIMLANVSDATTSSVTFTTLSDTKGLLISVRDGAVVADDWERFLNNVSVVPTKPLVDGITETVEDSLANTATAANLLSVGDFRDTQEILTGAITRNVGIKILDGTENWTALSSGIFQLSDGTPNFKSQPNNNIGYCNYFSVIPLSTNIGTYISNGQLGWDITGVLTISNTTTQTVTNFKQWLSTLYVQSTPVIVVYPLATPTTETVTGQTLTTQAGTNVIEISQANIDPLTITANYVANDGTLISFANETGYITGITSSDVTTALGYTPYNSTNPNNYTSVVESTVSGWGFTKNAGTVTSVNNVSPVNGNVTIDALPSQTSQSGKFLTTNGTTASWASVTVPTVNDATLTINQGGTLKGTFTANASSNITIDLENSSQRNLGEIVASSIPLTDAGLHLFDGALINGSGIYADFVTYIAGLVSTYPDLFETEANWQTAVTTYGVCGKFVYNSVNNTVRLPKITGIVEGTTDLTALGDLVQAGLPNITGNDILLVRNEDYNRGEESGGALYSTLYKENTRDWNAGFGGDDEYDGYWLNFDASRSSSIYGNSLTVQPQTIKVLYYIVIATTTKTEIEVDIDEIATDLNGKADTDLSNLSLVGQAVIDGKADVDLTNVNNSGTSRGASWSMPSNTFDDLTLGASGTQYTAPANGWYTLRGDGSSSYTHAFMSNVNNGLCSGYTTGSNGNANVHVWVATQKGQKVQIDYSNISTLHWFRFVYAQGSESEAS